MNRIMTAINFFGVLALGVLCLLQWGQIGRLQADAVAAARKADDQAAALSKEKQAHDRAESDLADVRDRLATSQAEVAENRKRAVTAERSVAAVTATVEQYKTAVAKRDAVLAEQDSAIKKLVADRDQARAQYNQLATKYNDLAKQAGG
jgi:chromosome segregation ATPase